jgi:hypothetical protein
MNTIHSHFVNDLKEAEKYTVIEIGAAGCEDTRVLVSHLLESGKPFDYCVFEPDPRNIVSILQAKVLPLVKLTQAAVGDFNGSDVPPSQHLF